jgi:hypothetical protein
MRDCGEPGMRLVTVDDKGNTIKMDDTGLLWGDPLDGSFTFEDAQQACKSVTKAQGYPSIPTVREKWRLATADEYARIGRKDQWAFNGNRTKFPWQKDIQGNETWMELPKMYFRFWSSSPYGRDDVWVFYSVPDSDAYGSVVSAPRANNVYSAVRCVARR